MSKKMHIQGAVEYLAIYSWSFLVIAIAIVGTYLFVNSIGNQIPTQCQLTQGITCTDLQLGSASGTSSNVIILMINSQPLRMINPSIKVNVNNNGNVTGECAPGYVLSGGAIICNATVTGTYLAGRVVRANLWFTGIPCPDANTVYCKAHYVPLTYTGVMDTQYLPFVGTSSPIIILSIANSITPINTPTPINATVDVGGFPLQGASINFSSNKADVNFYPSKEVTYISGNAPTLVVGSSIENAILTASFGTYSTTLPVSFTSQVAVTFNSVNLPSNNNPIVDVDGVVYSNSQLPTTFLSWGVGSNHFYSFNAVVGSNTLSYIYGCGVSAASGIISVKTNCTVTATYN